MLFIALQGNIASGKSTVLDHLELAGYRVIREPLHIWNSFKIEGRPILEAYYKDRERWGFTFQLMVLTQFAKLLEWYACKDSDRKIIIIERSPLAGFRIFARNLYEDNMINETEVRLLEEIYNSIFSQYRFLNIYLRCDPEVALRRLQLRGRDAENSISLEYINKLHFLHEEWLIENAFTVNANEPSILVFEKVKSHISDL